MVPCHPLCQPTLKAPVCSRIVFEGFKHNNQQLKQGYRGNLIHTHRGRTVPVPSLCFGENDYLGLLSLYLTSGQDTETPGRMQTELRTVLPLMSFAVAVVYI